MYFQYLVETIAWSLPAAALGWAVGFFFAAKDAPSELTALILRCFVIAFALLVGALAGTTLGFVSVREKRLWKYVKAR
jgi:hypothetical protein